MSIGPSEIRKDEEVPVVTRFSTSAKKVVAQYFVRPAYYLFFLLLALAAVALLIGKEPPVKFWILLTFIGLLNLNKSTPVVPEEKSARRVKNSNEKRK